ncbi:MAG: LTA synthase family protein [Gemmatimonadaceae bacterium]
MPPNPFRSPVAFLRQSPEGVLALRLSLLLAVYGAIRLVFLLHYVGNFGDVPSLMVAGAFVAGLRFDLSAITYANLPFILASLAPAAALAHRWYQRGLHALFIAVNVPLVLLMVADIGYFQFTGTRMTRDIFALRSEAAAQADQLLVSYAGLALIAIALAVATAMLYPRVRGPGPAVPRRWTRYASACLAVVVLAVVAARGGLQKKPLKPIHAFTSGEHDVGILTLNTAFTLIHGSRERLLEPVEYFASDREAEALLHAPFGLTRGRRAPNAAPRQNVVLLILESVSAEYWGGEDRAVEQTPFLDSLARHGTFLVDNFANGRRSMDALPSILIGVPLLTGQSIAVSAYQGNEWRGLGHFLGDAGYHTSMFHGAPKGTMFFDAIAAMAGIGDFRPLESYPADRQRRDYDGHWGLFDEPFLQWSIEEMGKFRQPFFSTVFTISTHNPYRLPPDYEDVLPAAAEPFHRSLRYLDLSVRRFFETASRQPWYDSTLFIVVGDHTPPTRSRRYETSLGRYMVPMLLFDPSGRMPVVDPRRITQHVDIFATILDYAGATPGRIPRFGRSLFSPVAGEAILENSGTHWLVTRDGVLEHDPSGAERLMAYRREATSAHAESLDDPELAARLSQRLRAYVQHYTSSMINNAFYRESHDGSGARAKR